MTRKQDLPERIGRTINELDIDFSKFTLSGWVTTCVSLSVGGSVAYGAYQAASHRINSDMGPALIFGITMIAVTVIVFLGLRWLCERIGAPITRK